MQLILKYKNIHLKKLITMLCLYVFFNFLYFILSGSVSTAEGFIDKIILGD